MKKLTLTFEPMVLYVTDGQGIPPLLGEHVFHTSSNFLSGAILKCVKTQLELDDREGVKLYGEEWGICHTLAERDALKARVKDLEELLENARPLLHTLMDKSSWITRVVSNIYADIEKLKLKGE